MCYCLLDPGSEWHLHRDWFKNSAIADLLGEDDSVASKNTLYRCLEKFKAMQMIDVHVPTTDERVLIPPRYTQPEKDLQLRR